MAIINREKNELGLSLVEVLATAVLVSIILVLVFSIVVSSQEQNIEQTKEVKQINDASYVLKVITKDVRNTRAIAEISTNKYEFIQHEEAPIIYEYKNNELYKNSILITNYIEEFKLDYKHSSKIKLSFKMNNELYEANLAYRKGYIQ